jgi:hypothetical protein
MGQAQVVIDVAEADALLITEMITYLVASRPLGRTGASSEPRPSDQMGQVGEFSVPSPDMAEAERPIMRSSAPATASLSAHITELGERPKTATRPNHRFPGLKHLFLGVEVTA